MWPELGEEWGLSPELYHAFDEREGRVCARCGSSLRARQLAAAIVDRLNGRLGTAHGSLSALCGSREAAGLDVAEINSAGSLHQFLARLPRLRFSEYGSADPAVPSEDLMALSYADGSFDLVVTSEVIEHVPDYEQALREIRRVLRPDGWHIFTVPLLWDRPTRRRATLGEDGKVRHALPPSYHGKPAEGRDDFLVFFEFGSDFPAAVEAAGFEVELVRDAARPTLVTFVTRPSR
jgi:SAM-dependent methyltransferase